MRQRQRARGGERLRIEQAHVAGAHARDQLVGRRVVRERGHVLDLRARADGQRVEVDAHQLRAGRQEHARIRCA
jgi:hypothetical protein